MRELQLTVFSVHAPVFRDGRFQGVFVATVEINELSRYLAALPATAREVPFVLAGADSVVAHPALSRATAAGTAGSPLPPLGEIEDPVLSRLVTGESVRETRAIRLPADYHSRVVSLPSGEEHVVIAKLDPDLGSETWTIGVHLPLRTIGGQVMELFKSAFAGVVILLAGAGASVLLALAGRSFGTGYQLLTRIGLNSGPMVGGTVGSSSRQGYTVHGDAVNLAARIEELNKRYDTLVLVAESTASAAAGVARFQAVGQVPIRGRQQLVQVFRVLTSAGETLESSLG